MLEKNRYLRLYGYFGEGLGIELKTKVRINELKYWKLLDTDYHNYSFIEMAKGNAEKIYC